MNTHQLNQILGGLSGFVGVFASNKIPPLTLTQKPQCLIVNLDPSWKPGSHWVAVCLRKKKIFELFDSYGIHPQVVLGKEWKLTYNPYRLQAPKSKVCGHYCVYFVEERLKGVSFKHIIETLRNKRRPDKFVESYVSKKFNPKLYPHTTGKCLGGKQHCKGAPLWCEMLKQINRKQEFRWKIRDNEKRFKKIDNRKNSHTKGENQVRCAIVLGR